MEIELKECPFCGVDAAEVTTAKELEECKYFESEECTCFEVNEGTNCRFYTVVCNYLKGGCGCTSGYFLDKETAIKRWNTRGESWR